MGELSDAEDHLYRTVARLAERGPFVEVMAQSAAGLSIHYDGHETSFQSPARSGCYLPGLVPDRVDRGVRLGTRPAVATVRGGSPRAGPHPSPCP